MSQYLGMCVAEAVRKHTLFTTNRGRLVEVAGGQVLQSTPSPTDVTKIVVHHAFEPLQLYIVLLCGSGKAVLLAYQDFKVLEKWEGVKEVASADPTATGTPHLILTKLDDTSVVMSKAKLMSHDLGGNKERKEEAPGKREAVQALTHRFKAGRSQACRAAQN
ncbi:hypothetical protein GWK47_007476 [Chionoecetes opilio]|uniref:Uncharacterized protein n=1 Tax=Chionoecetes opilio TaxID=41210 RepID=A0A8J5CBY1_CHIOP|nr:hypothetical protein GWK47_007476 [Chionoecetes opilio]